MSDMLAMVVAAATEKTEQHNALVERIGAATTDRRKAIADFISNPETTDPKVIAYQEFMEKANAEIERQAKAMEAYAEEQNPGVDGEALEALKEEQKSLAKSVKSARQWAETLPGYSEDTFKDVPALKGLRGKSGGGTGGKRPRLVETSFRTSTKEEWVEAFTEREDKENPEVKVRVTNFTVLAAALSKAFGAKVEVKDLQGAAFDAAGTDDLSTLEGKPFDFATSVGDKTVFVHITPKHSTDE